MTRDPKSVSPEFQKALAEAAGEEVKPEPQPEPEAPATDEPIDIRVETVYVAAPFFSPQQLKVVELVERITSVVTKKVFSPRLDGGILTPQCSKEERREIFSQNCDAIENADLIVAVIDDFDPGTIWEMGYAFAQGKPIVAYSDVPGRGLNVMLAQSCVLFANGPTDLHLKLLDWVSKRKAQEWTGDVQ